MGSGKGYADVADEYRQKIRDGELAPGDPLPPVNEMKEIHEVARNTAARAVAVLKSEGLVVTRAGAGTVVASPTTVISGADRLGRLSRTGRRFAHGEEATGRRVMIRSVADPKIARALDTDDVDECVIRIRTFRQDGRPTSVGVSVYPPHVWTTVPELAREERMTEYFGTLYERRTGREVTPGERVGYLRLASQDELEALELKVPAATPVTVFVTDLVFHDEDGPVSYWEDVYAPDEKIRMPFEAPAPKTSADEDGAQK